MTIDEALVTALELEHRVRDHFRRAADQTPEPEARRFFELMAREEEGHVAYLEAKLDQWRQTGALGATELNTAVPSRDWLAEGRVSLQAQAAGLPGPSPRQHLFTALELEHQVSEFYRRLVASVDHPEAEELFRRFLEIEDGHTALVQAEIDYETHTGNFFDVQEFTLDG
ncbi:MAG: ferritin family protein [Deferrisomatales bacterium]|nr:ferritin family protein [Deferrisomatales bacterium]